MPGTPALRLAEPQASEEAAGQPGTEAREAAGREPVAEWDAAELARRIEATASGAGDTLRMGPASAPDRLRLHREDMEEAARRQEEARNLPGPLSLGLELVIGALRLVGSMATAPIRLGRAFLRRDAVEA